MPDDKHKGEIFVESWSFGTTQTGAASTAGDLKSPPMSDAELAAGGGPHVKVFDGVAGGADAADGGPTDIAGDTPPPQEAGYLKVGDIKGQSTGDDAAIGAANGGVWKTTNMDPEDSSGSLQVGLADGSVRGVSPEPQAIEMENVLVTSFQTGGSAGAAGDEHEVEFDILAGQAVPEPEPGVEIFLKLPDVNGEASDTVPSISEVVVTKHMDSPAPTHVDGYLKVDDIPGETEQGTHVGGGGGGAGKVSYSDMHFVGAEEGPSGLSALEPEPQDSEYLEMRLHSVKVTSYSINGSGLDDATEEPSSMATLEPTPAGGDGEEAYLAISLKNAQVMEFDPETAMDGGTEHEDSWEDAL